MDANDIKHLEEQLRRRAEELEKLMDVAQVAIYVAHDPECHEITANPQGKALLEAADRANVSATPEPEAAVPWRFFKGGIEVSPKELPIQVAARSGIEVRDCELEARLPSGARKILRGHATPLRDAAGQVRGAVGAFQDITAGNQLLRANLEQHFLAEAGAILASSLDYDQTLSHVSRLAVREFADVSFVDLIEENGEIRRLRAVSRDPSLDWACEILSNTPLDRNRPYFTGPTLETQRPIVMESLSPETVVSFAQDSPERLRALRAIDPKSAIAVPLIAAGKAFGALAFVSSPSSRRFTADDLSLAQALADRAALAIENARLYRVSQQALRARDELLGVVAHDLRNPLSAIVIEAELLKHVQGELEPGFRDAALSIHRSAVRMSRLIQDLLDVTRVEAGHFLVERSRVSVSQLIYDAVEADASIAAAASVELRLEVAHDVPEVWADRERLLQAFDNLIGNALKFTRPGGRITLGAALNEDEVQFWVADTGSGVAAEDLPHVFDRFWQGHKGERRGTGLGLTIVKGIIEAHGGRIRVESTLGMGTTFFFALPTADHTVGDTVRAAAVSPEVSPGSEELTATHELVR
jgi:signal transduction histidine kinase